MTLTEDELVYYARQLCLDGIGLSGQEKLKNARVLCVGAGGLGSPLLLYLAAAGVGTLGVVDPDRVELSNLHRQILYTQDDIGELKAEVAYGKLLRLNPHVKLMPYAFALTAENSVAMVKKYDIIADCTDNFATRYLINDACFHANKPNVQASISEFSGQCSIFTANNGPCYRCLFDSPPPLDSIPNCAQAGVFGALPGLLANLQAIEIIKLITGVGTPLIGKLLKIDTLSTQFDLFALQKNPHCTLCGDQRSVPLEQEVTTPCAVHNVQQDIAQITPRLLKQLKEEKQVFILDVRDRYEYEIANIGGYLIPLAELPGRLGELNPHENIVVHCKKGPRSQVAAALLKQAGFEHVSYLTGGILAWKEEVEPDLAGY